MDFLEQFRAIVESVKDRPMDERVSAINAMREIIHEVSPFKSEPVDFVRWVPNRLVHSNDYNPNSVAPPEMELLRISIAHDGYTQPIVGMIDPNATFEVVDGFHRHRVGKECSDITERVHGYLPIVQIRESQMDKTNRMASTIRHNRARGKHSVEAMSEIVIELKRRNWSEEKIARELGMDADEVLRLCQITGLREAFEHADFSQAWEATIMGEDDIRQLDESDVAQVNNDSARIFHEWQDWECYPAGFYSDKPPKGMTVQDCELAYRDFLADCNLFRSEMYKMLAAWKNSCEHYLTNDRMNRIAWIGQASMCHYSGVPSRFCGGYNMLDDAQKEAADRVALEGLNSWLASHGRTELTWEQAQSRTQADLY